MKKRTRPLRRNQLGPALRLGSSALVFLAALGPASIHAQEDQDSSSHAPDGPLLREAPSYSQWTTTYSYAEDRAPKASTPDGTPPPPLPGFVLARPRTIVTTKTKSILHESITDLQQQHRENWYVGTTQYRKDANSPVWFENEADLHPDIHYTLLPASGYRDLDWISSKTYTGKMAHGGQDCLVFKSTEKVKSLDSAVAAGKDLAFTAYINAKTRLPVEVDIDTETRTYQFNAPPTDMQPLPEDLIKQVKQGAAGRALMGQAAARPY